MTLQTVIQQDRTFLSDAQRLSALLKDLFPHNKQVVNISVMMCKAGILSELQMLSYLDSVDMVKYINHITSEYGVQESLAYKVIQLWADALQIPFDTCSETIIPTDEKTSSSSKDEVEDPNIRSQGKIWKISIGILFRIISIICGLIVALMTIEVAILKLINLSVVSVLFTLVFLLCGVFFSKKAKRMKSVGQGNEEFPNNSEQPANNTSNGNNFIRIAAASIGILIAIWCGAFALGAATAPNESNVDTALLVQQTKENLNPYFAVMGADVTEGNPDVSQEFIDNLDSVEIMGYEGSLSHGWNEYSGKRIIELVQWHTNESVSNETFDSFIALMNEYFESEAKAGSYDYIADETWEWTDSEQNCLVLAWLEDSQIHLSWDLIRDNEEESSLEGVQ